MPVNQDTYNKNLYDLLSVRYDVTPINSKGQTTPVPQEADVFRFEFTKNGENYGDVWVTVDNGKNLVVYYDDQVADSGEENTSGTGTPDTWTHLGKQLKHWARTNLLSFELKNRNHLSKDMAQREHMKKKEKLGEGYYPMGKKSSYSDNVPKVKIVLQHTRQLEEGEQRFRNIAKIFVENASGERFAIPTTRPGLARVYARHIAEGGTPYDDKGKHITSLVEEYTKMAGFVRATRTGQFNEDAQQLVNVGINHYHTMKETLTRMTTGRGYNKYFENWTPVLNEESEAEDNLNELFVRETLDPRIESVMPILSKLKRQIKEMDEVKSLDEWAENTINEKLDIDVKTDESTRKHFKQVADVISQHPHSHKRDELAKHHADIFAKQNARFNRKKFFAAAKASDDSEKKTEVKEEVKVRYEVRDKEGKRLGTWDGIQFKSYDTTKHRHGDMIPAGAEIDKASGPVDAKTDAFVLAGLKEEQVEEGTIKYFHIVVDGVSKAKLKDPAKAKKIADEMRREFPNKKIKVEVKDEMSEDLDANQKRVGQLGPTEKVAKNSGARGKLVGASESVELSEMDKSQPSSDRGGESSGNPYAKGGKATPAKAKDIAKDAEKVLNKSMDKAHKKDVKESQDDLDAILRIVHK